MKKTNRRRLPRTLKSTGCYLDWYTAPGLRGLSGRNVLGLGNSF